MVLAAKKTSADGTGREPGAGASPPGHLRLVVIDGDDGRSDDVHLVAALASGDTGAFTGLMQRHLGAIVATARRIVRDEAEAEDIAQEAFLRLWRGASGLDVSAHGARPWLRRVASNLAIDWLRKARRVDVTDDVPDHGEAPTQLQALESGDTAGRMDEALAGLPERQRIAVSLFHFDELSQREVASMMEISEDALESLLARGRKRLRELLAEDWRQLLADVATDSGKGDRSW